MDLVGIVVSYLYIGLVIVGAKQFEKKGKEASRKFIHIMLGNWWFIAMWFFTNVWSAIFVPITFVVINYISYKRDLIKVMERDKQDGLGTVYYAIALLILAVISFGIYQEPILGLIPTLVMAYGDGLAAVIGKLVKSKTYRVGKTTKSIAGSITMFVISVMLITIYFIYQGTPLALTIPIALIMSFAVTVVEAVSTKGIDNISVPMSVLIMMLCI